jgi:hypothetical protein
LVSASGRVHELVEAPVGVRDGAGGDGNRAGVGVARASAEQAAEAGLTARHIDGVVAEVHEAGQAAAVRPGPGVDDAAAHVGKHGEHLRDEPCAVGARELQHHQPRERHRLRRRRLGPGPNRLRPNQEIG